MIGSNRIRGLEFLAENKNVLHFNYRNQKKNIESVVKLLTSILDDKREFKEYPKNGNLFNSITLQQNLLNLDRLYEI